MGYYVVGEAIPLPLQENPDYLSCFPKTETCYVFESKADAIRYARFKNRDLANAVCPLFKVKAIKDEKKVRLDVKEGESIKAKQAVVKKIKNIASASLKYLGNTPEFVKIKYSRDHLTKSFEEPSPRQSPPLNKEASESLNSVKPVAISFTTIMLAVISCILLFSTLSFFTSLPALFIHTLAQLGIIFVLPSSVMTAKIWFVVSLGTLATGALMGLYYGVRFFLGLLNSLVIYVKEKYEQNQQNRNAKPLEEPQPDLSYTQRLSQFLSSAPTAVCQHLPERLSATWCWDKVKQIGGLFVTHNPPEVVISPPKP